MEKAGEALEDSIKVLMSMFSNEETLEYKDGALFIRFKEGVIFELWFKGVGGGSAQLRLPDMSLIFRGLPVYDFGPKMLKDYSLVVQVCVDIIQISIQILNYLDKNDLAPRAENFYGQLKPFLENFFLLLVTKGISGEISKEWLDIAKATMSNIGIDELDTIL